MIIINTSGQARKKQLKGRKSLLKYAEQSWLMLAVVCGTLTFKPTFKKQQFLKNTQFSNGIKDVLLCRWRSYQFQNINYTYTPDICVSLHMVCGLTDRLALCTSHITVIFPNIEK